MSRILSLLICLAMMGVFSACSTDNGADDSSAKATATPATKVAAEPLPEPALGTKSTLTEAQWKERLSKNQFYVLREEGTERAFTGAYWDHKEHGIYRCAGCNAPLFESDTKFKSGTGWPSFWQPIAAGRVATTVDNTLGMTRTEVHCDHCGGHLGHIFEDGPKPTGLRYCINSESLRFEGKAAE